MQWVVDRSGPGTPPLICAIESARGLLAAHEIAGVDGVRHLPIGGVYAHVADEAGLRSQCEFSRSLGFFGKSAIHPRQLPVVHVVFTPSAEEVAWAREVSAAEPRRSARTRDRMNYPFNRREVSLRTARSSARPPGPARRSTAHEAAGGRNLHVINRWRSFQCPRSSGFCSSSP